MKLLDSRSELKALRTLCSGKSKISGALLAGLNKDSFYYPPTKEAFSCIIKAVQSEGSIPEWSTVCSDPRISDKSRRVLKAYDESPIKTKEKADSVKKALERFRQLRGLAEMGTRIFNDLEGEKVDTDALLEELSDDLLKVRSRVDAQSQMHHTGKGNNSSQLIKELLYGKKKKVVPTGFQPFDEKNGGFLEGSLVVIAANSGGGKSALANQLAVNICEQALEDVCFAPDTLVRTTTGPKKIQEVMVGDLVPSFNFETQAIEAKPVTGLSKTALKKRLLRIKYGTGELLCTEDHKIWCENRNEYVRAGDLKPGDKLKAAL